MDILTEFVQAVFSSPNPCTLSPVDYCSSMSNSLNCNTCHYCGTDAQALEHLLTQHDTSDDRVTILTDLATERCLGDSIFLPDGRVIFPTGDWAGAWLGFLDFGFSVLDGDLAQQYAVRSADHTERQSEDSTTVIHVAHAVPVVQYDWKAIRPGEDCSPAILRDYLQGVGMAASEDDDLVETVASMYRKSGKLDAVTVADGRRLTWGAYSGELEDCLLLEVCGPSVEVEHYSISGWHDRCGTLQFRDPYLRSVVSEVTIGYRLDRVD